MSECGLAQGTCGLAVGHAGVAVHVREEVDGVSVGEPEGPQFRAGPGRERDVALGAVLARAHDEDCAVVDDVVDGEGNDLAYAQAAGVGDDDGGPVGGGADCGDETCDVVGAEYGRQGLGASEVDVLEELPARRKEPLVARLPLLDAKNCKISPLVALEPAILLGCGCRKCV